MKPTTKKMTQSGIALLLISSLSLTYFSPTQAQESQNDTTSVAEKSAQQMKRMRRLKQEKMRKDQEKKMLAEENKRREGRRGSRQSGRHKQNRLQEDRRKSRQHEPSESDQN